MGQGEELQKVEVALHAAAQNYHGAGPGAWGGGSSVTDHLQFAADDGYQSLLVTFVAEKRHGVDIAGIGDGQVSHAQAFGFPDQLFDLGHAPAQTIFCQHMQMDETFWGFRISCCIVYFLIVFKPCFFFFKLFLIVFKHHFPPSKLSLEIQSCRT